MTGATANMQPPATLTVFFRAGDDATLATLPGHVKWEMSVGDTVRSDRTREEYAMTRLLSRARWMGLVLAGGTLFAGGCLPENYYSELLADAITTAVNTVVAVVANNLIPAAS